MFRVLAAFLVLAPAAHAQTAAVACRFGDLPVMLFLFDGGEGTVQVGPGIPEPLSIGSTLMTAEVGRHEMTFSLREPASVTVTELGEDNPQTFPGECESARNP